MERVIEKVNFFVPKQPTAKRVAAYARVSAENDAMHHSLAAQVCYYSDFIEKHPAWIFAGVYADEAKTGTKDNRVAFQQLLTACRSGKVDMIITKSVSRFARNTITLLETVRELKTLGIDIFFEEQNIHTLSDSGELMLTILASFAQEESRSVSENQLWRVRRKFEEGKPWNTTMLGYRYRGGELIVCDQEAAIVRRIFREYLAGKGGNAIAAGLNADGIPTRNGNRWIRPSIMRVLRNYAYTGNLLLQKTYRENYITKKRMVNEGQLPKYHAEGTHEAIIDLATFNAVQRELERRAETLTPKPPEKLVYPFSRRIVCGCCGKHYRRKVTPTGPIWICTTYNTLGKAACPSKAIPETILMELTAGIDFNEIIAEHGNMVRVRSGDGETVLYWQDRSRSESWTEEMKSQARQKRNRGREQKCQEQSR